MALLFQFNILGLLRHYSPQYIHIPIILLETTQGGVHVQAYIPASDSSCAVCCITPHFGSANVHNIHVGIEYCAPLSNQQCNALKC